MIDLNLIEALSESNALTNPLSALYLVCKHWGPVIAGWLCCLVVLWWVGREAMRDGNE